MAKSVFVPVFVRSPNNYDMKEASDASGFDFGGESRTQQQFREECDINTIVRRFGITGQVPVSVAVPLNGDFVNALDFRQSLDVIVRAREAFDQMPSNVRSRFHNDAAEFLDFVSDESNRDEARKLGLLVPPVAPPEVVPMPVRIVPEAPADK